MLAAITDTNLSRRACALCRSAMISRRRRRRTLGPPVTSCGGIRWASLPCVVLASACSLAWHLARLIRAAGSYSPHAAILRHAGQHNSCRVQIVCRMEGPDGKLDIILGDQDADFDLGSRDHLDVDALLGQGSEHGLRHARMRTHPDADDRDLGHGLVRDEILVTD